MRQAPTFAEFEKLFTQKLRTTWGDSEVAPMLDVLMARFAGLTAMQWRLNKTKHMEPAIVGTLEQLIERLEKAEPLAYLLGEAPFMGMLLKVNEHTLIPRPETEELVAWAVSFPESKTANEIWDLCTGSGCIGLAMKKCFPKARVHAADVSKNALMVAQENAREQKLDLQFHAFDLLQQAQWPSTAPIDIIISNPPYVLWHEKEHIHPTVWQYEPGMALFVDGDDPLLFYKQIEAFAASRLKKGGALFFELNPLLAKRLKVYFTYKQYRCELKKDLSDKWRFLRAVKSF